MTSSTSPRPCTLPHSYLRRPFLLNESDKMRSHTLTTLRCLLLLALAVGSIPGCSSRSDIPALGEVTGTVTLDGAPLEGATVTFAPPKGRPSTGMTNQQGQFMLDYAAGYQGAMIGNHTVRISTERYTENPDGTTDFSKETVPFLKLFRPKILCISEDIAKAGEYLARSAIHAAEKREEPPMQFLDIPQ